MSDETFDNIPLLDDLIKKGSFPDENATPDLEAQINDIFQRHSAQAVAEIMTLIKENKNNNA